MNGSEVLRIVDAIHRDKNIAQEIVFEGIEQAIQSAAKKHFGEEEDVVVDIHRQTGEPTVKVAGEPLAADEIGDLLGRIAAQTAKQVMIQKIREAERDALYDEYTAIKSQIVNGTVSRIEGSAATVSLGKVEGILPRSEQIPGETHRVGERIRAVVMEVRKAGSRVKIVLSRAHSDLVRRLFEIEIPEIAERVIEVRSISREAGYRSKVAVSCIDSKIDAVGACVGVRGSRIKNIIDELAGERIDIVRWNDSLQVLVPNAMQPAKVDDVILCPMLGKVIVLVQEDQLSLAIGKKGQNVRLASKLVGWDISVLTQERLDEQLDRSIEAFSAVPGVTSELAESLVSQGFFTFEDLSVIEPDQLAELGSLSPEQCDEIIAHADAAAERIEREEKRLSAERARLAAEERALGLPQDYGSMGTRSVTGEIVRPGGGAASSAATAVAVAEPVAAEAVEEESSAADEDAEPSDAEGAAPEAVATDSGVEVEAESASVETQSDPAAIATDEAAESSGETGEPQAGAL